MEKTSTLVHNIFDNTKEYVSLKTKAIKLDAYEKAGNAVAGAVGGATMFILGLCAFLFLNVGIAYWLSDVFDSTKLGFLTLGGFYVLLIAIYMGAKKMINNKIRTAVVTKASNNHYTDFALMVKEKESVDAQLERSEVIVKANIEELKENLNTFIEDVKRIKHDIEKFKEAFSTDHNHTAGNKMAAHHADGHDLGSKIPRAAVTSILDLVLNKLVLKGKPGGWQALLPIIANTLISSQLYHEDPKTSLIDSLKLKLSKLL